MNPRPTSPATPSAARGAITGIVWCIVVAICGAMPGGSLRRVVLERAAPPLSADVGVRDGAVDVHLRDAAGAPIAGGRVRAFAIVDGVAFAAGEARSSAAGAAALGSLSHGEHWIVAEAEGRARASSHVVVEAGRRAIDLVLGAERSLDLVVEDERGAPIGGAEVEIGGADPLPIGARAGDDGRAHVGGLGDPPWSVTARAAGYEELTLRGVRGARPSLGAVAAPVHVVLRRLGALVVRVVDAADAPVAGAHVQIASIVLWPARVATTSADGSVRIGGLAAATYALRAAAAAGDGVSPTELGVPLARGEERAVTLKLGPGRRVAVHVTDADDGAPIAGARVTLAEAGLSPFPIEGATDAKGTVRLGPIARGAATVAARADGFVARGAVAVPELGSPGASPSVSAGAGGADAPVEVALARGGAIVGRVVDARGHPIDGAMVQIVGTDFTGAPIDEDPRRAAFRDAHFAATLGGPAPLVPAGELGVMPGPVPAIPRVSPLIAAATTSAAGDARAPAPWVTALDGRFRAAPIPPGRVRALVRHPQYTEGSSDVVTLAAGGEASVDVVLHAGGTLEGKVVDGAGNAVSGARVALAAARGTMERATRAATDGTFAFAAVPELVTLLVSREDDVLQVVARVAVEVPEATKRTITIALADARPPLPVRVVDARGDGIDAAQISASSLDPSAPLRTTAFTDAHGDAKIGGARGLPLRVEVRAPGRAPTVLGVDAAAEKIDVTLAAAERAIGEVRASNGRDPIDGAEIVFYTELGARRARADRDGKFALDELAPGPARVRARAAGYAPAERAIDVPARGGDRPFEIPRIELVPEGIVDGIVVDARGDPVPGARVAAGAVPTYLAVGATPTGVAVADGHGRFHLPALPEGWLTLEAYAPEIGRAHVDGVRVLSGHTTDRVRIALGAAASRAPEPASAGGVAITLGETDEPREVIVAAVAEGSEAERAGLSPGDTIIDVDGAAVATIEDARARLSGPLADDVVVRARRAGATFVVRIAREAVRR